MDRQSGTAVGSDRRSSARESGEMGRRGIILKSDRELELMRRAGLLVNRVLNEVRQATKPGVSTADLNDLAEAIIRDAGAKPLFKGVVNKEARFPFPAALCTSVNEQVVHGIPNRRPLCEGDIVSVDCGVQLEGYCGDAALTIAVGEVSADVRRLLETAHGTLKLAIAEIRPGRTWGDVARLLQKHVESQKMGVVRDFVGHGIGRSMHEEPKVPNYWDRKRKDMDFKLVPRLVIAVEPMVNLGTHEVTYADGDRWTVRTKDGRPAAHFEHTIAVTEDGCRVLTLGEDGSGW